MMPPEGLKRSSEREISPPPAKRKAAATTTQKAVANFFKPASSKVPDKIHFQTFQRSLVVGRCEGATTIPRPKPTKIAAFDLDDTIIKTKSAKKFSLGPDDWQWWHACVPAKLKQLHEDGYAVVFVSNQNAISLTPDSKTGGDMKAYMNFKAKVTAVFKNLDLPITLYAATEKDLNRKPRTGMWDQVLKDYGLEVLRDSSFFVGDAAGRTGDKSANVRKDHSCSDRDFAANVGIAFHTPEEFFLDEEVKPFTRPFCPSAYLAGIEESQTDPVVFRKANELDVVLLCGSPGAGKSTFYWQHMKSLGYGRVNQDLLKTREKCLKMATQLLQEKQSVAVDNTNADIETRSAWITLAAKLGVPCRLVHFTAPAKLCEHNATVRALSSEKQMNPEDRMLLPKMAFNSFTSRYREPKLEEGFQDITEVAFVFEGNEDQKAQWEKYWIN
ncbi:related to bifunctional polynucleotide phosphatase/kinase [Ramularia collo-cygni]|uniref:Related to bifunctional polynucleotide phosphatase/kinase n=1 Tax=Ramularia collo-cygni TaxID=112498 RepID=A0A2D3V9L0_9PEZI|nr:related to bifunctional polynucleotide phosphatase/kinase [Ramularia collo-cygni]CZT20336.1 related to bifunctional polynucleotide phosphatase/kinase [Ramularia collo-cygni]